MFPTEPSPVMAAHSGVTNQVKSTRGAPLTASSRFSAVDKILGYEIAPLNPMFNSGPVELSAK